MHPFQRYQEAIHFLEGLSNIPAEKNYMVDRTNPEVYLKRIRYFLDLLGNPEKDFRYIHITGTAGKGTVTTMLHEILHASGKRVGSFTSPFSTTSIEKIRVGDAYISSDEFADIVDDLKPVIDKAYVEGPYRQPSYFELFLIISLVYFKRKRCEWVVLEVGLGGRYDATNIIQKPVITAITNIDFDHTGLLGKTLKQIAYDKAGLIKKGSFFFTTEQRPALIKMFQDVCRAQSAIFHHVPRQQGYQEANKALVRAIALKLSLKESAIKRGIEKAHLPCRFEVMQRKPLVVLDGAHNRVKIKSVMENLDRLSYHRLFLIIGISDDKDHFSMLEQIVPRAHQVYFTRFQIKDRPCTPPSVLWRKSRHAMKPAIKAEIFLDPQRALSSALHAARAKDLILVVGSFYLAGELRQRWISEEKVLRRRRNR